LDKINLLYIYEWKKKLDRKPEFPRIKNKQIKEESKYIYIYCYKKKIKSSNLLKLDEDREKFYGGWEIISGILLIVFWVYFLKKIDIIRKDSYNFCESWVSSLFFVFIFLI
jgi:hypothetical protein